MDSKAAVLSQLDAILDISKQGVRLGEAELTAFYVSVLAAIDRIAGPQSAFAKEAATIMASNPTRERGVMYSDKRWQMFGTLQALRAAVEGGYLQSLTEAIHGDVAGDFLEVAEYLLQLGHPGHKDAAAVLAGGVLETHLRQLCAKHNISVTAVKGSDVVPKKADTLNTELAAAGAYGKLDQKNVTAWLDLRNKAAHAHYSDYTSEQVALLIQSTRDFITRVPA